MKTIYLFTSCFPYGKGENFIEDEILIVPQNYKLIIVPFRTDGNIRKIPEYIELDKKLANNSRSKIIQSFFSFWVWKKLFTIGSSKTPPKNIKEYVNSIKYIIGANIIRRYIKKIALNDGDVLYSYWFNHIPLGLCEGINEKSNQQKIKIVSRAHGYDVYEKKLGHYFPYREETFDKINEVFCISEDGKKYLSQRFDESKIKVSHLGVWQLVQKNKYLKNKNPDRLDFVSCSFVVPVKRLELIFNCINEYAKNSEKQIGWTHYGDGILMNDLKKIIKSKANNLQIDLKGFMPKSEILNDYKNNNYDIFVNLSSSEGVPVSIMEAISYGIPVIACDVGGNSEILGYGAGICINSDVEQKSFNEAVERIIADFDKYSKNAFKTFELEFNAETNYTNFYSQLLDNI